MKLIIFTVLRRPTQELQRRCGAHHYNRDENTPLGNECCLLLVLGVHLDLIVTIELIQKVVPIMTCHHIQYTVCKRKGKGVGNCFGIKFLLGRRSCDPDFVVLLQNDDDWAKPRGRFYRPNEPNSEEFINFFFNLRRVIGVHSISALLHRSGILFKMNLMLVVSRI